MRLPPEPQLSVFFLQNSFGRLGSVVFHVDDIKPTYRLTCTQFKIRFTFALQAQKMVLTRLKISPGRPVKNYKEENDEQSNKNLLYYG